MNAVSSVNSLVVLDPENDLPQLVDSVQFIEVAHLLI